MILISQRKALDSARASEVDLLNTSIPRPNGHGPRSNRNAQNNTRSTGEWPIPEPIGSELPPVRSLTPSMMPEVLRGVVEDTAERLQVPIDFPAVAAMLSLAGAVNRRAFILPKAHDTTWKLAGNLWGALISAPGVLMKSPVLHAATQPLIAIEELWRQTYRLEMEEYQNDKEEAELRLSAWKQQKTQRFKDPKKPDPIRPDTSMACPTRRRLIINDATNAAGHKLMADNTAGLLLVRDELIGWIEQLDAPGRESERAMALECWNANGSHTIDRIERGEVHVPFCCLSVIGGLTPARLRAHLIGTMQNGPTDDGFIQRFQVMVYPDAPKDFKYVDRLPAPSSRVLAMFERLTNMDTLTAPVYSFSTDAQDYFVDWYECLQKRLRSGELHAALTSHLSKYPKLLPTIALLCALADGVIQEDRIDLGYVQLAADWCAVLETHAQRVYACVVSWRMQAAADLAQKLKTKALGKDGLFLRRDVYRHQWSGLDTPEKALGALEILQDAGWVRQAAPQSGNGTGGGRPPERWLVNPRIWQG